MSKKKSILENFKKVVFIIGSLNIKIPTGFMLQESFE